MAAFAIRLQVGPKNGEALYTEADMFSKYTLSMLLSGGKQVLMRVTSSSLPIDTYPISSCRFCFIEGIVCLYYQLIERVTVLVKFATPRA